MRYPLFALCAVLAAAFLMITPAPAHAAEFKAAFVEMTRALNQVEEGKAELEKLEGWQKKERKDLEKEENSLMQRQESLKAEEGVLSQDAYRAKVEQFMKDFEEFRNKKMNAAKELQNRLTQATLNVKRRMDIIVAEIAQRDGYTMVVDISEGGVMYYPQSMDITNEIIRMYDKRYPLAKKPATPTPKKK